MVIGAGGRFEGTLWFMLRLAGAILSLLVQRKYPRLFALKNTPQ
jgi:hypothetical protein